MKLPPEVDKLLQAYFAGDTSSETIQAMEAWLREDPANPRILAEYGLVDRLIFCEQKTLDTAAIFAALLEAEEAAGPIVVTLPKKTKPTRAKHPHEPLRYKEAFLGLQSIAFDALRQKAGVITAIAAVLALALVLIVSLSSNSNQPLADSTADESNEPGPVGPALNPVATLTASHNATWAERALERGSALHPNQRLTLTAGFAEITTAQGAVAILEAPCVVELTDNDNALHLHTGKLVGICETPSSKGFVVYTPHMDITDLGTRFGVDATKSGATEVHVFEGEVQATRGDTEPVLLLADQSAKASARADTITATDHAPERFAAIRTESGLGSPTSKTVLDTDTNGTEWLITTAERAGSVIYQGNQVACTVDQTGFTRAIVGSNAYGFVQYTADGAGLGQPATATGTWTFTNLPAGRYDVATAFKPNYGSNSIRYMVNGVEVFVDQSSIPAPDAGPAFEAGIRGYAARAWDIQFTLIGSSVAVPEGGSITVTIDNANNATGSRSRMDSVAITLVPEAGQD